MWTPAADAALRPPATCRLHTGKHRYPSVAAARRAAARLTRRQHEDIRAYRCPGCRGIFVGHAVDKRGTPHRY